MEILKNAWSPPILFFDFNNTCLDLLSAYSHKPRINTSVLFELNSHRPKEIEYLGPSLDAQDVCAVANKGTVLSKKFCFTLYVLTEVLYKSDGWIPQNC